MNSDGPHPQATPNHTYTGLRVAIGLVLSLALASSVYAAPAEPPAKGGRANNPGLGLIYVTSQNAYYETFVTVQELPWNENNTGSFQELYDHTTDFGPGDPGYRGGRWWVDSNPNGYQDAGDTFLLCPLLGPAQPGS